MPPESFGSRDCLDTCSGRIIALKEAHVLLPQICDVQRDLEGVLKLRRSILGYPLRFLWDHLDDYLAGVSELERGLEDGG